MWKCSHCGETSEDAFDSCWHCGTGRDGSAPVNPQVFEEQAWQPEQSLAAACPFCGGTAYSWGRSRAERELTFTGPEAPLWEQLLRVGGHSLTARPATPAAMCSFLTVLFMPRDNVSVQTSAGINSSHSVTMSSRTSDTHRLVVLPSLSPRQE